MIPSDRVLPMAPLDLVSSWMDTPARPLDFVAIHRLTRAPSAAALAAGATSARLWFAVSGSRAAPGGRDWLRMDADDFPAPRVLALPLGEGESGESDGDSDGGQPAETEAIRAFVDAPFDIVAEPPVKQLMIIGGASRADSRDGPSVGHAEGGRATLVTRFHHAACDGIGAGLWLSHQWNVAFGNAPAVERPRAPETLALRTHPAPRRKSRFALRGASPRLMGPRTSARRAREWRTFSLPMVRPWSPGDPDGDAVCSPGDVLATAFLDALLAWDTLRRGRAAVLGLWLPVNIRRRVTEGFGNGSSRIRVYAHWSKDAPRTDKIREFRRQVSWSLRHGEWAIPSAPWLSSAPVGLARCLVRAYVNRPFVDMGSAAFTYVPRYAISDTGAPWAAHLASVESVGLLHRRHSLSLAVVDVGGMHTCTFTYDPGRMPEADVAEIARSFVARVTE